MLPCALISYCANNLSTAMRRSYSSVFRALADGTRRDILELLRSGPVTSGEIAAQFGSSWPTISRHLSVLRACDLVTAERRGQEIYYELNTSVLQDFVQHLIAWGTAAPPGRRSVRGRVVKQQEA
jgi:DNA-binding transcriptional ArsR family regulator